MLVLQLHQAHFPLAGPDLQGMQTLGRQTADDGPVRRMLGDAIRPENPAARQVVGECERAVLHVVPPGQAMILVNREHALVAGGRTADGPGPFDRQIVRQPEWNFLQPAKRRQLAVADQERRGRFARGSQQLIQLKPAFALQDHFAQAQLQQPHTAVAIDGGNPRPLNRHGAELLAELLIGECVVASDQHDIARKVFTLRIGRLQLLNRRQRGTQMQIGFERCELLMQTLFSR
jgi:hypothetical protein